MEKEFCFGCESMFNVDFEDCMKCADFKACKAAIDAPFPVIEGKVATLADITHVNKDGETVSVLKKEVTPEPTVEINSPKGMRKLNPLKINWVEVVNCVLAEKPKTTKEMQAVVVKYFESIGDAKTYEWVYDSTRKLLTSFQGSNAIEWNGKVTGEISWLQS